MAFKAEDAMPPIGGDTCPCPVMPPAAGGDRQCPASALDAGGAYPRPAAPPADGAPRLHLFSNPLARTIPPLTMSKMFAAIIESDCNCDHHQVITTVTASVRACNRSPFLAMTPECPVLLSRNNYPDSCDSQKNEWIAPLVHVF